jgi:hypothetical protein
LDVFVLVALAFAVVSLGAVAVAAVTLWRAGRSLADAGRGAGQRMGALTAELADEQAVMALELEAIGRRRAAGAKARRGE